MLLVHALALLGVAIFALGLRFFRVVDQARTALAVSREAMETMRRPELDDDAKEAAARRASSALFLGLFSILLRAAGAVLLSASPTLLAHALGFARLNAVAAQLLTVPYIVAGTLSLGLVFLGGRRAPAAAAPSAAAGSATTEHRDTERPAGDPAGKGSASLEQIYSPFERLIHRIAFSSVAVQLTAAEVGKTLYASRYKDVRVHEPVFITSLPRAGTTLLLDVVTKIPGFASHTYRDMPFVMAPLLWNALSSRLHKPADLIGRAHGDGMLVSYDSPEAFEEVIWRAFWPEKFRPDGIALWSGDEDVEEFAGFLGDQMRRVIALRMNGTPDGRYVSKNNANVSRIDLLKKMFPDALIVVPFRHPIDQAASLLKQHLRFSEIHQKESFSRRYMEDIGHLEFGALHRPLDFAGMDVVREKFSPDSLGYWLGYWVTAFEHVLERRDKVILLSYERSCANGAGALRAILERLHVAGGPPAELAADPFHGPRSYRADVSVDAELRDRALATHARLLEQSIA